MIGTATRADRRSELLLNDAEVLRAMNLLVVGAGEMGRWFARNSGADDVAFADRENAVAQEAAASTTDARVVELDTDECYDVVCVAIPMLAVPEGIADHAAKATGAVVDVSGEMRDSVDALQTYASNLERASFHPLFSATNAPGNVPVVIDQEGPLVDALCESIAAAGNDVFRTTVEAHDNAMETVQAKAHAAVLAYALAADPVDERFHTTVSKYLSEVVRDVTDNNPSVYAEIQSRFHGASAIAEGARDLAEADRDAFEHLYEMACDRTDR